MCARERNAIKFGEKRTYSPKGELWLLKAGFSLLFIAILLWSNFPRKLKFLIEQLNIYYIILLFYPNFSDGSLNLFFMVYFLLSNSELSLINIPLYYLGSTSISYFYTLLWPKRLRLLLHTLILRLYSPLCRLPLFLFTQNIIDFCNWYIFLSWTLLFNNFLSHF